MKTLWSSRNRRVFTAPGQLVISALCVLLFGFVYYLIFRWQGDWLAAQWSGFAEFRAGWHDWSAGALPAFVHMLSLSLLAAAALGLSGGLVATLVLLLLTVLAEFTVGVFDPGDLVAAAVGATVGVAFAAFILRDERAHTQLIDRSLVAAGLVGCSSLFIGATSCIDCYGTNASPIYLSYANLRRSIVVEPPRALKSIERVYLYGDTIFLNQKNQGVHVLDNSDPKNPVNVGFIVIPGNTELSIRDSYLYADSYVDLVTLNIEDSQNVREVKRQENIFPYDAYQNIDADVYFSNIDESRGVVVSYAN